VDRGVPEVFNSTYDVRSLLAATEIGELLKEFGLVE
jgi:myosin-crossreactive antigen